MEVHVSEAAQIIAAMLVGTSALLRALAVFLPAWRGKPPQAPLE